MADLENYNFDSDDTDQVDTILVLDVIEHLRMPEAFLRKMRIRYCKEDPMLIITTGNIAYFLIRFALFFGQFNYGSRGILDLDHTRLFTFNSMRRMLIYSGYIILEEKGIPAPFPLALGDNWLARFLVVVNLVLIRLSKTLFSYQIGFVVRLKPTLEQLLADAAASSEHKLNALVQ